VRRFNDLTQEYFGQLNGQEQELFHSYFKEEKLQKNGFFTKSGKVGDKFSFVKSGILRMYVLTDGKEITQWISAENSMVTDVAGFFFDQPNRWNIQAFTDTELLTITKTDYLRLCEELPTWNVIEKRFILKCFMMMEDRIFSHLAMSAEERYDLYYRQNRELFNHVPLQHIASVLGMTAETFSRIRKRKTANS